MNPSLPHRKSVRFPSRRAFIAAVGAPLLAGCLPIPAAGPQPGSNDDAAADADGDTSTALSGDGLSETPPAAVNSSSRLQLALDDALDDGFLRRLSMQENGAWQVLHGVLAYGLACLAETPQGPQKVVSYLQSGGKLAGFSPMPGDLIGNPGKRRVRFEVEGGSMSGQGHRDQWLAVLSQTGLGEEAEFLHDDLRFTLGDAMQQLLWDVPRNLEQEYSWSIIAVTRYRPTDFTWVARDGATWSVERLLQVETEGSLESAACGGTHRLIGIAMALNKRRQENAPIAGVWEQAEEVIQRSIKAAQDYQNGDGSFSTTYLYRHGWSPDLSDVLRTTGHVLEFLSLALEPADLASPWVEASAQRLCDVLKATQSVSLECGALYHALHGVILYRQRRYPVHPWLPPPTP